MVDIAENDVDMACVDIADYIRFPFNRKLKTRYKKLVVPHSMRSIYWKYFGFPADNDAKIITKEIIVCVLCKIQMKYNRNTSNLRVHLLSRHKTTLETEESDVSYSKTRSMLKKRKNFKKYDTPYRIVAIADTDLEQGAKNEIVVSDDEEIWIVPSNIRYMKMQSEKENPLDVVINFLVTDLISPSIAEGKGFNKLLSVVSQNPGVLPRRVEKLISNNLKHIHSTCKEKQFETINSNCIVNVTLAIEEWKSVGNRRYLSIFMHYLQTGVPTLFTKLLTTTYCTGNESESYWQSFFSNLLLEWSINLDSISAVLVAFNNDPLINVLKAQKLVLVPCFLRLLQHLCSDLLFEHETVSRLLEKCRTLTRTILEMKLDIPDDQCEYDELEGEECDDISELGIDYSTMWITTYYMIRNLLRKKNTIIDFIGVSESVNPSIMLSASDWKTASEILLILQPLKTIIVTLLKENYALISLVKPLLLEINNSHFELSIDDSRILSDLKSMTRTFINNAYTNDSILDFVLQMATALDPRFKDHFADQDFVDNTLVSLLTNVIQPENVINTDESCSKKNSSPSTNAVLKSNKSASNSTGERVRTEISYFQKEQTPQLEDCPLEWWQNMRNKCPNLSTLASKFLCIPSLVTWHSRGRSWKDYSSFCQKRGGLETGIDSLLFLNNNQFSV